MLIVFRSTGSKVENVLSEVSEKKFGIVGESFVSLFKWFKVLSQVSKPKHS